MSGTLLITPMNKKLLIDGGGTIDNTYDVGKNVVVPYLLDRGVKTLDYVMISHFDADHCNGLIAVLETLNVKKVIISKQTELTFEYENIMEIIKRKKIPVQLVQSGDRIILDKYTYIDILYPDFQIKEKDLNNNAIVAKLVYGDFSMLFTGDIEAAAEKYLVGNAALQSVILKIAHHGSKTSSTKEFLNAVDPKIVLIGVGQSNTFGHPHPTVIERLEDLRMQNI